LLVLSKDTKLSLLVLSKDTKLSLLVLSKADVIIISNVAYSRNDIPKQ
jgi:hypothetical protein